MHKTYQLKPIKRMPMPQTTWKTVALDILAGTLMVGTMLAGIIIITLSI